MPRANRDQYGHPVPAATELYAGVAQLAQNGEVSNFKTVPGRDNRLVQRVTSFPVGTAGQIIARVDLPGDPLYRFDADLGAWTIFAGSDVWSGELLMQDGVTSPPVPLESEDGADWLYEG